MSKRGKESKSSSPILRSYDLGLLVEGLYKTKEQSFWLVLALIELANIKLADDETINEEGIHEWPDLASYHQGLQDKVQNIADTNIERTSKDIKYPWKIRTTFGKLKIIYRENFNVIDCLSVKLPEGDVYKLFLRSQSKIVHIASDYYWSIVWFELDSRGNLQLCYCLRRKEIPYRQPSSPPKPIVMKPEDFDRIYGQTLNKRLG